MTTTPPSAGPVDISPERVLRMAEIADMLMVDQNETAKVLRTLAARCATQERELAELRERVVDFGLIVMDLLDGRGDVAVSDASKRFYATACALQSVKHPDKPDTMIYRVVRKEPT